MALDEVFRRPVQVPGLEGNPVVAFAEWTLRGIGQVVFQNNWMTGLVILAAIFYNSWVYGIACLAGVGVSTLTAIFLKADRGLISNGLFGFNGALLAIALTAYLGDDFAAGQFPDGYLWAYIAFGAAFTSVVFAALGALLGPYGVPALTAPFVITAWLFIFAAGHFAHLHPGPGLVAGFPAAFHGSTDYSWTTWYQGTGKGVGEIFFQDNWVAGYLILAGIFVNSRVSAAMGLTGAVLAVATAMVLGGDEASIRLGLFGFNAVLTAIAIGGVFYVLTVRAFVFALFGTAVTTWAWAAVAVALAPVGMPALTSAFVVVTWLMLIARDGLPVLVAVPPTESTTPDESVRRWRRRSASEDSQTSA
jgi:urea transporter